MLVSGRVYTSAGVGARFMCSLNGFLIMFDSLFCGSVVATAVAASTESSDCLA